MKQPKDLVNTDNFKGFTNIKCEFYPCHDTKKFKNKEFNCLFCYCPLQYLECPGPYIVFKDKDGIIRKDCSNCKLPHDGFLQSWRFIQQWLKKPIQWDFLREKIEIDYMENK